MKSGKDLRGPTVIDGRGVNVACHHFKLRINERERATSMGENTVCNIAVSACPTEKRLNLVVCAKLSFPISDSKTACGVDREEMISRIRRARRSFLQDSSVTRIEILLAGIGK